MASPDVCVFNLPHTSLLLSDNLFIVTHSTTCLRPPRRYSVVLSLPEVPSKVRAGGAEGWHWHQCWAPTLTLADVFQWGQQLCKHGLRQRCWLAWVLAAIGKAEGLHHVLEADSVPAEEISIISWSSLSFSKIKKRWNCSSSFCEASVISHSPLLLSRLHPLWRCRKMGLRSTPFPLLEINWALERMFVLHVTPCDEIRYPFFNCGGYV